MWWGGHRHDSMEPRSAKPCTPIMATEAKTVFSRFALENFDTVGRWRDKSDSGLVINSQTTLPDGTQIQGLSGLREYLLKKHRDTFVYQFCRKLLGYAIGREVRFSDRPLLAKMQHRLKKNNYRFSIAVETIVLSEQFRRIRENSYDR